MNTNIMTVFQKTFLTKKKMVGFDSYVLMCHLSKAVV